MAIVVNLTILNCVKSCFFHTGERIPRNNGVLVTIVIFISILVCMGTLTGIAYKIKCGTSYSNTI